MNSTLVKSFCKSQTTLKVRK